MKGTLLNPTSGSLKGTLLRGWHAFLCWLSLCRHRPASAAGRIDALWAGRLGNHIVLLFFSMLNQRGFERPSFCRLFEL